MLKPSITDVIIALPVLPLLPVLATWFLPWESWLPAKIPKVILGPYLVYAALAAWHFRFGAFTVFMTFAIGIGLCVAAIIQKLTGPETSVPETDLFGRKR